MWFKNLQLHRLPAPWDVDVEQLQASLAAQAFQPGNDVQVQSQGWVPPRGDDRFVYPVQRQLILTYRAEKKLLPASVVNQVTRARAQEIEEQQGFKPGRKQMKELREQVTDELLPRAFSLHRDTRVWIDAERGWLVIDTSSQSLADDVRTLLLKSIDRLPLGVLRLAKSPVAAMTGWLLTGEAPQGFTVDQDTELRANGSSNAKVRYVGHTLENDDVREHIKGGKQCTRLAMTWNDRVSFVLTPSMVIKQVTPLDVLKESADPGSQDAEERFESDVMLMTAELSRMLADLTDALGGEVSDGTAMQVQAAA